MGVNSIAVLQQAQATHPVLQHCYNGHWDSTTCIVFFFVVILKMLFSGAKGSDLDQYVAPQQVIIKGVHPKVAP